MIDRDMTAPFMAVVMTGRSAKADKGEAVEVHCYSGKWDSARCKRSDGEFVWLSFKNLEHSGPVSDEVASTLAAERKAFKAETSEMLQLGTVAWQSDKATGIDVQFVDNRIDRAVRQRVFLPKSQIKDGSAPRWLVSAKVEEILEKLGLEGVSDRSHYSVEDLLKSYAIFTTSTAKKIFLVPTDQALSA